MIYCIVWDEAPHYALLLFAEKKKWRFLEVPIYDIIRKEKRK